MKLADSLQLFKQQITKRVADEIVKDIDNHWSKFSPQEGDPPREVTGELNNSIHAQAAANNNAIVYIDAPYAGLLEYVGVGKKRTKYPFARPAIMRVLGRLQSIAKEIIKRVF